MKTLRWALNLYAIAASVFGCIWFIEGSFGEAAIAYPMLMGLVLLVTAIVAWIIAASLSDVRQPR